MPEKRGNEGAPLAVEASMSDPQLERTRIRQRWEFASVLNFLHVFEPVIGSDLKLSAEEIEAALIKPNDVLMKLHVALLKGIPPVAKNMIVADAWVTVVCKKLASWWQWVAEGENPLKADHGKEIQKYRELDPITRTLILKALCEVRAEQDDVVQYITDELKKGTNISAFRKERMASDGKGINYWYDGDPVMGHRLYKEVVHVESKQRNGKGRVFQLTNDYQWETLATELQEFQEISDKLSSSKINAEAAVGDVIKTEIVPVLEEIQKKKERAMKRKQRQALELNNLVNYTRVGSSRTCRERRPACYTFEDYDRSIDEAIQISKKLKTERPKKENRKPLDHLSHQEDGSNGREKVDQDNSETDEADLKETEHQSDEDEDDVYSEKDEGWTRSNFEKDQEGDEEEDDDAEEEEEEEDDAEEEGSDDSSSSDVGKGDSPKQTLNLKLRFTRSKVAVGLRRSERVGPTKGLVEAKKRTRQRPTRNSAHYSNQTVSDSDDSSPESGKQSLVVVSDTDSGDASDE